MLVVDDNSTNSHILERLLNSWGMLPAVVSGGVEALQMMEDAYQSETPFPLVLLDFQMPKMDGFAVAERIKKTQHLAAATIMMLTSGGKRGDAARCRSLEWRQTYQAYTAGGVVGCDSPRHGQAAGIK